jgi:hypothetical protein
MCWFRLIYRGVKMLSKTSAGRAVVEVTTKAAIREKLGSRGSVRILDRPGVVMATLRWVRNGDTLVCFGVTERAGRPTRFEVYREDGERVFEDDTSSLRLPDAMLTPGTGVELSLSFRLD